MKIAALFPGYGSQFVGMAKDLYDESRLVQEHFEQAANCLDMNFVKLCFASSDIEIAKINNAFPALFLVSSSIFDLLKKEGVEVDLVAGYNIGQYAAMHAAGSLSLPDGLYLLNKFVAMYQDLISKNNIVFARIMGINKGVLEQLCQNGTIGDQFVTIAIYDSQDQHIIAGTEDAVERVCRQVVDMEGTTETIGAEVGLHSTVMNSVAESFKMYLAKVDFKDASTPLLCNVNDKQMRLGKEIENCAVSWITQPVLWSSIVDKLHAYDLLIEIGPGTQLRDMLKKRYPDKKIVSVNNRSDIEKVKSMLNIKNTALEK